MTAKLIDKCQGLPPSTLCFILCGEQKEPHRWQHKFSLGHAREIVAGAIASGRTRHEQYTLVLAEDFGHVEERHERRLAALEKARAVRAENRRKRNATTQD